jgi:hypothetical protein
MMSVIMLNVVNAEHHGTVKQTLKKLVRFKNKKVFVISLKTTQQGKSQKDR